MGAPPARWPLEMADHLMFRCPFAASFWQRLSLCPQQGEVRRLHRFDAAPAVCTAAPGALVMLCCWHLWKRRNVVVFRSEAPSLAVTLKAFCDEAALWRGRFRVDNHAHVGVWSRVLSPGE